MKPISLFVVTGVNCLCGMVAIGQVPVSDITTAYETVTGTGNSYSARGGIRGAINMYSSSGNTFNYRYGSDATGTVPGQYRRLISYIAGGITYMPIAHSYTVRVRRNGVLPTPSNSSTRDILFYAGRLSGESTLYSIDLFPPYDPDTEHVLQSGSFLTGSDNVFQNAGNNNVNNIERIDVMVNGGMVVAAPSNYAIPVFERGGGDRFKIGVITQLDGAGNPSAYSNIVSVDAWTASYELLRTDDNFVLKRDGDSLLRATTNIGQNVKGISLPLTAFGIGGNTTIYGFSLFPYDYAGSATAGAADPVLFTNTAHFSLLTEGEGGIDLVSVLLIAQRLSVLPVTIEQLYATPQGQTVVLQWATLSEQNSRGFDIEKSADGRSWGTVGTVPSRSAAGHSTQRLAYTYTDRHPLQGRSFYRLKQTDFDGNITYSKAVPVVHTPSDIVYTVFPNPATDRIYITYTLGKKPAIRVVAADGRPIAAPAIARENSAYVDIVHLPAGIYYLLLESEKDVSRKMFIRSR